MKPLALLAAVALLSGCTFSYIGLQPRPPITGNSGQLSLVDARPPANPEMMRKPLPERGRIIGHLWVLKDGTAVELLGSVVAARFPTAQLTLKEFEADIGIGMWSNLCKATIAAEVRLPGRDPVTVTASGANRNVAGGERNMEIAIERALEDFMSKLALAIPAS